MPGAMTRRTANPTVRLWPPRTIRRGLLGPAALSLALLLGACGGGPKSPNNGGSASPGSPGGQTPGQPASVSPTTSSDSSRPENAKETKLLTGPAALVGVFRRLSAPLLTIDSSMNTNDRAVLCRDVATALDAQVDRDKLLDAAMALPDSALAEIAVSERRARSDVIVPCVGKDRNVTDDALKTARAVDAAFNKRVGEL